MGHPMCSNFAKFFASMWYKAEWVGCPMKLELTRKDLQVKLAYHYTTRGAFTFLV